MKHKELDFSQIKSITVIEQLVGMYNIPVDSNEQFVQEFVEKFEKIKSQSKKKDRKLNNAREESNGGFIKKVIDEQILQEKTKQLCSYIFILLGTFVVDACLTIMDYLEISSDLAAVALDLFFSRVSFIQMR
ncbi:MAG: hypothetical protein ACR5K2_02505 [Wolbachia sp.]